MRDYCGHAPPEPDCLQCLHAVNATLRQRAERAEAERDEAIADKERILQERAVALHSDTIAIRRLSSEGEAAQSTIAELREAIEKAPHALYCLAAYNDCSWPRPTLKPEKCDCWKRGALGE